MNEEHLRIINKVYQESEGCKLHPSIFNDLKFDLSHLEEHFKCGSHGVYFISILLNLSLKTHSNLRASDLIEYLDCTALRLFEYRSAFEELYNLGYINHDVNYFGFDEIITGQRFIKVNPVFVSDLLKGHYVGYNKEAINSIYGKSNIKDLMNNTLTEIDKSFSRELGISGIPSGYLSLDKSSDGFQPGTLTVLAGRPAMGKSALALNIAMNASNRFKVSTAIISLEMDQAQVGKRLISSVAEVPYEKIHRGTIDKRERHRIDQAAENISKANLIIDDTPMVYASDLVLKVEKLATANDVKFIVIDYLQLIESLDYLNSNKSEVISDVLYRLKYYAKLYNISILITSQLSRDVEMRGGDYRPMLSDLSSSSKIEEEADVIMFLYRYEYYGIMEDLDGNSTEGMAEVIIAKNRFGPLESVPLKFIGKYAKFENMDYNESLDFLDSRITREEVPF